MSNQRPDAICKKVLGYLKAHPGENPTVTVAQKLGLPRYSVAYGVRQLRLHGHKITNLTTNTNQGTVRAYRYDGVLPGRKPPKHHYSPFMSTEKRFLRA